MAELYQQITGFQNLYSSFKKAFKGKKNNPEAADFHLNLEKNLFKLKDDLLTRKYKPGKYHILTSMIPKKE